jgi:hypothetical protein
MSVERRTQYRARITALTIAACRLYDGQHCLHTRAGRLALRDVVTERGLVILSLWGV